MVCYFEVLHFVKMCPIFDGSVLTDFEKYEKITWLPVMWTYRTIQFWVPFLKMFYPEILYPALFRSVFFPFGIDCWNGNRKIKAYGQGNSFLVNYYGPPSGYKVRDQRNLPPWGTFPKYSLAYIIDTDDVTLRDPMADLAWMSQFLPGETPEWINAIEDENERNEMLEAMGIGGNNDISNSPLLILFTLNHIE